MNEAKVVATNPDITISSETASHPPPVWEYLDLESSVPKIVEYPTQDNVEEDEGEYISPLRALSTISSQSEAEQEAEVDPDIDLETTQTSRPKFLQPEPSSVYDPCKPLLGSVISPDEDVQLALENARNTDQYTVIAIPASPSSIHAHIPTDEKAVEPSSLVVAGAPAGIAPTLSVEYMDSIGAGSARSTPSNRRNSSSSSSSSTSMDSLSAEPVDEEFLSSAASNAGSSLNAQSSDVPPPVYDSPPTDSSEEIASPTSPTGVTIGSKGLPIPKMSMDPPLGLENYERHVRSESVPKEGLWKHLRKHPQRKRKAVKHRHWNKHSDDPNAGANTAGETSTKPSHLHVSLNLGRHRLHKDPPKHTT